MSTRVRASGSVNYIRNSFTINSLELVLRDDAGNPAPATAGNALIGLWAVDKNSGTFSPPAGWTVLANTPGNDTSFLLCGKIAEGGETSVSASWVTVNEGASGVITERAPSTPGAALSFGPVSHPPYVTTDRTSMALGPLTAAADVTMADAVAFFGIDSIGDTAGTPSRFAPTATGWTHAVTATAGGTGTGTPAAAITDRNTSVGPGGTVPSTTFSWVNADQTLGAMVLVYETESDTPPPATTPTASSRAVGIPSPTSAPLTVKTADAASVRIRVGTNSAVTQGLINSAPVTPDAQGLSDHVVTGLTAGQRYYYRVVMTDADGVEHLDTFTPVGEFRAAPVGQTSFAFTMGSCSYDNMGDINASAQAIAARRDDLFLSLGDWYDYDGSGDTLTNFRAKFDARMSTPGFAELFATTPFAYTPSDHDGMNNDSTANQHPTAWSNWNTVYRERVPTLDLPGATGVYHTFVWGRVRFIVMDCRSFRGASGTTILGSAQKQWLKDTITAATEAAIVLVQDGIWIGSANADTWHLYPAEQTELANHFAASGKNIALIGGDMHAVAADDGTNSPGGIAVFQAAPLNGAASRKGGPYTHAPYPASGSSVVQQYGRVVVTDAADAISLAYTGYSADGTARVNLIKTYSLGPPPTGSATGTWATSGSSSGRTTRRGSAAPGTLSFTGSSVGKESPKGSAASSWRFASAASGIAARRGSASGTTAYSGSGRGGIPRLGSAAPGTFRFTGSAVGKESPKGSASGTVGFVSAAGGKSRTGGTAFGLTRFAATTSAHTARRGSASGMTSVVSSAVGFIPANGIGTATPGTFCFIGGATGDRGQSGAAIGSLAFSGSARGSSTRDGRAVSSWCFSGGAYTAPPRWVATETIFFGEGAAFVRAFNDEDPVPRSVILHRSITPVVPTPGSTA